MKRSTVIVDRLTCAVTGAAVLALGITAAAWQRGDLPVPQGGSVRIPALDSILTAAWWPFALGALAIVLIIVGLRWLFSHRPGQLPPGAVLPGSTATGALTVDLGTAAAAAAASLAENPYITSSSGAARIDRGQHVIELDVKIDPAAGLAAVSTALDTTRRDLAVALNGVEFTNRILLRTPRNASGNERVK